MDLIVPYAIIGDSGALMHISSVEISGNYVCPECKDTLIFKNGSKRIKHFAHKGNSGCSLESIIHAAAKQVILNNQNISLGKSIIDYVSPRLEVVLLNRRPDAIIDTEHGRILVEVACTNFITEAKISDLRPYDVLEIDLSTVDYSTPFNILEDLVLFSAKRAFYKQNHKRVKGNESENNRWVTAAIGMAAAAGIFLVIRNFFKKS